MIRKTLGVITPATGASPELNGVAVLKRPAFGCPNCPSLAWGGCGGREFPRTCAAPHPVPTLARISRVKFSVKVIRHIRKIKSVEKLQGVRGCSAVAEQPLYSGWQSSAEGRSIAE